MKLKTKEKSIQYILFRLQEQRIFVKAYLTGIEANSLNASVEFEETEIYEWIENYARQEFENIEAVNNILDMYNRMFLIEKNILELFSLRRRIDNDKLLLDYEDLSHKLTQMLRRLSERFTRN